MNSAPKRQQGLTFISLVFILVLIAFFVLLILKIGPIYLDHSKVTNVLAELEESPDIETKSEQEIRETLNKRFNMNYVDDVTQDDIKITKSGRYSKIVIEYEVVKKIAGNLSVLVNFNDVVEVGQE
jgi:cell division protein FtsI/penicillin-binding protein 2